MLEQKIITKGETEFVILYSTLKYLFTFLTKVNFRSFSAKLKTMIQLLTAGLDMVLDKLRVAGADFSTVAAISGERFSNILSNTLN